MKTLLALIISGLVTLAAPIGPAQAQTPPAPAGPGAPAGPSSAAINPLALATSLTDADKMTIRAFVEARRADLSGEPEAVKAARNALLAPLSQRGVSVAFRLEFKSALFPVLEPLVSGPSELHAANALRIAGEVAAPAYRELMGRALKDARPGVRYAATFGAARFFEAVGRSDPAASAQQLTGMIRDLRAHAAAETHPRVLDGCVLALSAGARIPVAQVAEVRHTALSALAAAAQDVAKAAQSQPEQAGAGGLSDVLLRAGRAVREALADPAQATALPPDTKAATRAMGEEYVKAAEAIAKALPNAPAAQVRLVGEAIAALSTN